MCLLFNIREMLLFNIINEELLFGALRFQHSFFTFFFFLSTTSRVFTLSLWILHWNLFLVGWCPLHCFPSCPSLSSLSQPHLGWADQSQIQRHTLSKQFVCGNAGCPGNLHQEQSGRSPETTFGWLEKHTSLVGCSVYSLWLILLPAVHWLFLLTWTKWVAGCQGRFPSNIFSTLTFWSRIWLQYVRDGHNSLPNSSHRVMLLISYGTMAQHSMCCSHSCFWGLTYTAFSSLRFPKCFPNPHCLGLIWKDSPVPGMT